VPRLRIISSRAASPSGFVALCTTVAAPMGTTTMVTNAKAAIDTFDVDVERTMARYARECSQRKLMSHASRCVETRSSSSNVTKNIYCQYFTIALRRTTAGFHTSKIARGTRRRRRTEHGLKSAEVQTQSGSRRGASTRRASPSSNSRCRARFHLA